MANMIMRHSKSLWRTTVSLLALCLSMCFVPGLSFDIGIRSSPRRNIRIRCVSYYSGIRSSDRSAWTLSNRRRQSVNRVSTFLSATASSSTDETDETSTIVDVNVSMDSPVLKQVYPSMLQHLSGYGHPNIPLGSTAGRQCETLRRLRTQQKLTASDVELLDTLTFRWHSLEDVAKTADFQELFARLLQYRDASKDGDVSPPKKYTADPELGAWVTGLRRVGEADTDADRVRALNDIGFQWESPRQCGSAFMMQYRNILERLNVANSAADPTDAVDAILSEPEVQQWIQAQREATKRGTLSETRQHYMESVAGANWLTTG
jgi:hypothetical protein